MQQNRFKMLLCLSANILRACCIDLAEVNRYTSVKQESCVCSPVWCRVDKIPVAFCLMIKSNVLRFHHSCFYPFPSEGEAALGVFGGVCVCVCDCRLPCRGPTRWGCGSAALCAPKRFPVPFPRRRSRSGLCVPTAREGELLGRLLSTF